MMQPPPTPIAIAVVEHAEQVLIAPRPQGTVLAGYWEFPGGKVVPGESPAAAAVRECREETGLSVQVGSLLAEIEHTYEHGHLQLFFFSAQPLDLTAVPQKPYRWVPRKSLSSYLFPPANARVLAILEKF